MNSKNLTERLERFHKIQVIINVYDSLQSHRMRDSLITIESMNPSKSHVVLDLVACLYLMKSKDFHRLISVMSDTRKSRVVS